MYIYISYIYCTQKPTTFERRGVDHVLVLLVLAEEVLLILERHLP